VLSTHTYGPHLSNGEAQSSGFFNDSGAVGGTFAAVGIVVVAIILVLAWLLYRRRKVKRMDAEVMAAASAAAATTRTPFDDDEIEYGNEHNVAGAHDATSPMMQEYYAPYEGTQYPGNYPAAHGYTGVAGADPYAHDAEAHNAATGYLATARAARPSESFYEAQSDSSMANTQPLIAQQPQDRGYPPNNNSSMAPGTVYTVPTGGTDGFGALPGRHPSSSSTNAPSSNPHTEFVTVNEHMPPEYSKPPQIPVFNGQQFTLAIGAAGQPAQPLVPSNGIPAHNSVVPAALAPGVNAPSLSGSSTAATSRGPAPLLPETAPTVHTAPSTSAAPAESEKSGAPPQQEPPRPTLVLSDAARAAAGPEKVPFEETIAAAPPLVPNTMPNMVGSADEIGEPRSLVDFSNGPEHNNSFVHPFERSHIDGIDGTEQHSGDGEWDPPALSSAWFPRAPAEPELRPGDSRLSDQRPYPFVFGADYDLTDSAAETHEPEGVDLGKQNNA
jgi:hypothetical protein